MGADGKLQYEIGADASAFNRTVESSMSGIGRMGAAFAGLAAVAGGAALARGFNFAKEMADSEKAIANVIAKFQSLNREASANVAADAMAEIKRLEPETSAGMRDMVQGFIASTAAAQSAGISVKENVKLVALFANALANANIPAEQLAQEMRSILTGNINADSALARTLGITNESVNKARNQGKLMEFLVKTIGTLGESGDTAAVAFSTLQSAVDGALGAMAAPIVEETVKQAKALAAVVADPQIQAGLKGIGTSLVEGGRAALTFVPAIANLGRNLVNFTAASVKFGSVVKQVIFDGKSWNSASAAVYQHAASVKELTDEYQRLAAAAASANSARDALFTADQVKRARDWADAASRAGIELEKAKDTKASQGDLAMVKRLDEKIKIYRDLLAVGSASDVINNPGNYSPEQIQQAAEMMGLEQQRAKLLGDIARREREVAAAKADSAAAARREVAANATRRGDALAELAIIEAQAAGHDKKAQRLERELRLQQLITQFKKELNATDEQALELATRRMNAEEDVERRANGQRRKIRGHTQGRGPVRGFGGLDEFDDNQHTDKPADRSRMRTPGLDEFSRLQNRRQDAFPRPGQPNAAEEAMRRASVSAGQRAGVERAKEGRDRQTAQTTVNTAGLLGASLAELKQIKQKFAQLEAA